MAVLATVIALAGRGSGAEAGSVVAPLAVTPDSVVVIDPETNSRVKTIRVGNDPGPLVVGHGSIWVANVGDSTLTRIDAESQQPLATIGLGVEPTGLAVLGHDVWIAAGRDRALLKVDSRDNRVRARLRVRERIGPLPAGYDVGPSAVAASPGAIWLAHGDEVTRFDPTTLRVVATIPAGGNWSGAIASVDRGIWVAVNSAVKTRRMPRGFTTGVSRIDRRSNRVLETIRVPGLRPPITSFSLFPGALTAGEGSVWIAASAGGLLWRVDTQGAVQSMKAGFDPTTVAVGADAVWVENHGDETVLRVDPFSNESVASIAVGRPTWGIAAGEGAVWVAAR
jgi:DNA-binding beta-propeller fold protein YncE